MVWNRTKVTTVISQGKDGSLCVEIKMCKDGYHCVEILICFLPPAKKYSFPSSEIKLISLESKEVKQCICTKKKNGCQNLFHSVQSHLGFCKGKSFA